MRYNGFWLLVVSLVLFSVFVYSCDEEKSIELKMGVLQTFPGAQLISINPEVDGSPGIQVKRGTKCIILKGSERGMCLIEVDGKRYWVDERCLCPQ